MRTTAKTGAAFSAVCLGKMGHQISQQLIAFGQSILLGVSFGVLYDFLRPFRLRSPRFTAWLDLLYCLTLGCTCFLFILRRGNGEIRGFLVLGAAGGAVLFFCIFSQLLRPVWGFWADTLAFFVHLLSFPIFWSKKICKKTVWRGKNLFYFIVKCYTIKKSGGVPRIQRRRLWPRTQKQPNTHGPGPVC